ncbi:MULTISPECIES: DNA-3-methyladenine glycosylase family protein [Bacillus cereus group]|uniref:DNA-3-methyladenine glycosylase II n=1 Tax=Bacillus cytotoxicus (strain DSM 22905 / CIP 110041 / 391-98 / NVH 391-98) TaxID=315749 RepID=A7GKV9_BACCN|nr:MULTISPECIES: DNA-3-methyladenine glycosylase [Bacillus cereus group]ABS20767.1 DNA-3-methyladenine glycosylase II [Bacillus cytotoxicus NVH 391-98]MDH2865305.1 DNA-3-methyladenine glycosylase [Bacillus cytotoxicus]MDH2885098.1 DNA-3-methyladenine glycosylase [Bacillus cytotoxicus]MDH2889327.1 DNA-3-methyladenine glycosylase [Bacillus cytotoxicus]NZD33645.1 DNA-3-methyladenine glycosylase 2 family protein [Bacillus cytotoxicus]
MWSEHVTLKSPYHFEEVLRRLSFDPLHRVQLDEKIVYVPLFINGEQIVVRIQGLGTIEKPQFWISSETGQREQVMERIYTIFQWNESLQKIQDHFQNTSLHPLFETYAYTPLILEFDYFACLLRCIIHQQVNLKFATVLTEQFVKTYGTEKNDVFFFPTPERVAKISIEELRGQKFSQRKAEYMIGLAKQIVEGKLNLSKLEKQTEEEISAQLLPVRGIGAWTVQNFLLFGLGRRNMFPKTDIGIQRALQRLFQLDNKPDDALLEQIKQECEPYCSYAALYLWKSIE